MPGYLSAEGRYSSLKSVHSTCEPTGYVGSYRVAVSEPLARLNMNPELHYAAMTTTFKPSQHRLTPSTDVIVKPPQARLPPGIARRQALVGHVVRHQHIVTILSVRELRFQHSRTNLFATQRGECLDMSPRRFPHTFAWYSSAVTICRHLVKAPGEGCM